MSEQSGYPGAPPGWYADPAGGPGQRWWDGYAWTEATVLPQTAPPPPWSSAGPPQQLPTQAAPAPWAVSAGQRESFDAAAALDEERRRVGLARVAVAVPGVYWIANLLLQRVDTVQLHAAGRQLRIDWDAARAGKTAPVYHAPPNSYAPIGALIFVLAVAAVIIACIWQHKAASAGRALGIPSRYSPAWGVGCWFVPVVNFWMPFGAIRSCLRPDDPRRALVLQWWIALMLAWSICFASGVAALFSSGVGLALAVPGAVACVAVIATAPRMVTAIAAAHEEALAAR